MAKIRVYELATKLGLDNKVLVDKLNQAGIEVKNHMSALEEEVAHKFEAGHSGQTDDAQAEAEVKVEVKEERIGSGLIRRRRKVVVKEEPEPVVAPAAPEDDVTVIAEATSETEEAAPESEAKAEQKETASEEEPVKAESAEVVEEPQTTSDAAETKEPAEKAAPAKKKAKKETVTRAKILGRVELPTPTERPRRKPAAGDKAKRPAPTDRKRPDRPARPGRPAAPGAPGAPMVPDLPSEKEGRSTKKKKKGRDNAARPESDGQRRKSRREVYEPDRNERYRKGKKAQRPGKKTEITQSKAIKRKIRITDVITIGELAKRMGVKANELIKELMSQGQMVTINHPLDFESAAILSSEFGYEVENVAFDEDTILEYSGSDITEEDDKNLVPRPPVITIMGHVDHGKTSLLDVIREANVTEGEAGGITQHIGAYDVELDGRRMTFLDTPGHEAFTAMRARGAEVTDIVVLVVAADDGVMPQTKEAINHSKAAGVPIIVAVNKIDKPGANPDKVMQELSELDLLPESWGGETIYVNVSAKEKTNIDKLLEMILLQAEVLELKADPNKRAQGAVIEARLDKGRGPVTTVLVQKGTLKLGDPIVAGIHYGRVRSMADDRGREVLEAGPSFPVEVTGLTGVPEAGESFHGVENEKVAKDVAQHRHHKIREAELAKSSKLSLDELYARIQEGDVKELKVIVKADVQGSAEAVSATLTKLSTDACRLIVIHSGVGGISETDISLASASDAIVLGFNVRPAPKATRLAELEGVDIRLYNIIYDAVNDIRDAMEGLLAPTLKEEELGRAEVREAFNVSKVGTIAGCYVSTGKILRNANARLLRDDIVIWTGKLTSLRRFKDDVKEVSNNYECGIGLENYNDVKPGDIIEAYTIKKTKTAL
ncbi:MAG: translation initiation factor IF-2 [Deltaproteobacteria bacterium]|nr:translation initiation factor IF-2 [Deltaproteobacteria bacterium]